MNLVVMYCVMQRVQHGVRGIVILVVMGWPLVKKYIPSNKEGILLNITQMFIV
jgi:hypothetical protein